jgi:transcriptional regulator with GAF, ATPase, and Fis domain
VKPRLQVAAGPLSDNTYFLTDAEVRIGRDPSNSLAISDLSLSRRHCLLSRQQDSYKICDLDSRNGTFVNGGAVSEASLSHGDRISVGESVFVFLSKDEDSDEALVPAVEFDDAITQATTQIRPQDVLYLQPEQILKQLPATSRLGRNLNALLKISRVVHSISDLNQLQGQILELIFEVVPAERGAILLDGTGNERFSSLFVHPRPVKRGEPVRVSRTITRQVMEQAVAILGADVPGSGGLSGVESLATFQVRSLLCVPLTVFQKVIGCIYLDTTNPVTRFDRDHLELVASIAGISAVALENARRLLWLEQENLRLAAEINLQHNMVGESNPMKEVYRFLSRVAPTDATVLVGGESGTGKELVARAIHQMSPRRNFPFVTLNCAAIPTGLLESELFGYERGAFTGALSQKIGRFEMAHRGTLFLDEVGDIPLDLQPKLLRALQEKAFERLGGTKTIPIDVRLLAATNRNLTQMMGDHLFRSDLYYRLKVFPITTPPLRDHPEDIPILARHFTKKYAAEMGRQIEKIPSDTMRALVSWPWPGNVRELENFIERSVILSRGPHLRAPLAELRAAAVETTGGLTLEEVERDYILRVFRETGGVISTAATRLGVPRTTLNAMMKKLGISRRNL